MSISKQLKYIKNINNLTQNDMAKMTNITQSTMSDWLNGKVSPTIDNLLNLTKKLNISINYLCGEGNEDWTIKPPQLSENEQRLIRYIPIFDSAKQY